ncbi:MAG: polysaccharide biosynthesis tyrosine autokinase [Gordonia polyisoprenivorans]|nr:polysaccharide biosynthesis tyrosine autokinase [Gordonia polyisoprenivorans]
MPDVSQVTEDGDSLRKALVALRSGWLGILAAGVVLGAGALAYSAAQTPEYSATSTLYVTSGTDDNSSSAYQGSLASQQRVASYTKLVTSDAVVTAALQMANLPLSPADAKSDLSAVATTDTVLLSVTAVDPDRDTAAKLSNAVSNAMIGYVARLETPSGGGQPLAKLTLVTPAVANSSPVTPKTVRNVGLGFVVGLLLGVVLVLVRARLSNRIRVEADVAAVSSAPVLASIPSADVLSRKGLLDFRLGATAAAEAFRKLRTNLTFAQVDDPPRILLVTSAVAVEGKTTVSMNLAASLVDAGKRVVLVDADLRRPQVNSRTGLVGDVGITNYLRGDGVLNDLVQPTEIDGLWVLASGPTPPNPAELLATNRAGQALAELSKSFEYVIVDSPPVLPVTDAVVLSQWVQGVLLVARSGSTRAADLSDAFSQIAATQRSIVGFVLTDAPVDKARYGYYAVQPKKKRFFLGSKQEPKAIEQVLEPKHTPRH